MTRRQFGTIIQRGRGTYRLQWVERGKKRSKTVRGTMRDAKEELRRIEVGLSPIGDDTTFGDYWRRVVRPSCEGLAPRTVQEYDRLWEVELAPRIGREKISAATWRSLQDRVIADIAAPGIQRSTARLLSKICNMAVRDGIIEASPCAARFDYRAKKPHAKTLVTTTDAVKFLESVRGLKYEPAILAMLGGGLRMEEASALLWEDVAPWEYRGALYAVVSVSKTVVTAKGGPIRQDRTKTPESCREVVLGHPFASRMLELRDTAGCSGPLVPNGKGGNAAPLTIAHNWKAWCAAHGVPYVRMGDMRTCWSTMQAEAGSPDSLVSLAMGHTDGTTRGSHYLKGTRRMLAMLADNLQEAIEGVALA